VQALFDISPFHFIILALATYRLSRLLVIDNIFEWLRNLVWKRFPPSTTFGYFFTCIWCTSVWTASAVAICYTIVPIATVVVASIFALSAVAGLISMRLDN
jgi:hypothetical protein